MIPKIIHQIWIGPKPAPTKFMDTWKEKNPEFTYIRWNENEIKTRFINFRCQNKINEIEELCGKADIIRLEILYNYGGIYIDADSICIQPLDDLLLKTKAFASYEHEEIRKGLISNGTIGFPPKHPLLKKVVKVKKKYSAHDENNKFKTGDKVSIIESKPFSKNKKFQVMESNK